MSERNFKIIPDDKLDKLSYGELEKEILLVQNDRLETKAYIRKLTTRLNGIMAENEALRTLTPEAAAALGMPEDQIKLIKEYQAKRKKAIAEGKGDVVIQHRHTLTMTPAGVKTRGGDN